MYILKFERPRCIAQVLPPIGWQNLCIAGLIFFAFNIWHIQALGDIYRYKCIKIILIFKIDFIALNVLLNIDTIVSYNNGAVKIYKATKIDL
jgi:hypothetical protein